MFMSFQKEKIKKVRNSSIFNLDSYNDDNEILTHKGKILSDGNYDDNDFVSDDDDNGALNKEVVDHLHFGGGLTMVKGSSNNNNNNKTIVQKSSHQIFIV